VRSARLCCCWRKGAEGATGARLRPGQINVIAITPPSLQRCWNCLTRLRQGCHGAKPTSASSFAQACTPRRIAGLRRRICSPQIGFCLDQDQRPYHETCYRCGQMICGKARLRQTTATPGSGKSCPSPVDAHRRPIAGLAATRHGSPKACSSVRGLSRQRNHNRLRHSATQSTRAAALNYPVNCRARKPGCALVLYPKRLKQRGLCILQGCDLRLHPAAPGIASAPSSLHGKWFAPPSSGWVRAHDITDTDW